MRDGRQSVMWQSEELSVFPIGTEVAKAEGDGSARRAAECGTSKKCKVMAKVGVKPLADRVLIKPMEAETKTVGGIYIPDTAKEKPQRGTVVAVGKGTKDVTMELKDGDVVLYGKYSGTEITIDDEDYLIMKQGDVLAIL